MKINQEDLNQILKPYWGKGWWPFLRIDSGWCDLVNELHTKILAIEPKYTLCQIKEKFGTLRFYYDLPHDIDKEKAKQIDSLVNKAEAESSSICETCGSTECAKMVAIKGWLSTKCNSCLSKYPQE